MEKQLCGECGENPFPRNGLRDRVFRDGWVEVSLCETCSLKSLKKLSDSVADNFDFVVDTVLSFRKDWNGAIFEERRNSLFTDYEASVKGKEFRNAKVTLLRLRTEIYRVGAGEILAVLRERLLSEGDVQDLALRVEGLDQERLRLNDVNPTHAYNIWREVLDLAKQVKDRRWEALVEETLGIKIKPSSRFASVSAISALFDNSEGQEKEVAAHQDTAQKDSEPQTETGVDKGGQKRSSRKK